jgi:hypothetical protein
MKDRKTIIPGPKKASETVRLCLVIGPENFACPLQRCGMSKLKISLYWKDTLGKNTSTRGQNQQGPVASLLEMKIK